METRRQFIQKAGTIGLGIFGGLVFPEYVFGGDKKKISPEELRKKLEPRLDSLTKKIIQIESKWDPLAKGKYGAIGLMQVRPIVLDEWKRLHPSKRKYQQRDLFDPHTNIMIGEWYLQEVIGNHYLPYFDLSCTDENKAAAYNMGPTKLGEIGDAIENFSKLPLITKDYLRQIWRMS